VLLPVNGGRRSLGWSDVGGNSRRGLLARYSGMRWIRHCSFSAGAICHGAGVRLGPAARPGFEKNYCYLCLAGGWLRRGPSICRLHLQLARDLIARIRLGARGTLQANSRSKISLSLSRSNLTRSDAPINSAHSRSRYQRDCFGPVAYACRRSENCRSWLTRALRHLRISVRTVQVGENCNSERSWVGELGLCSV